MLLPDTLPLMSLRVTPFESYSHVCACIESMIGSGQKAFSVAINPEKICKAYHDRALADLINKAQIFICDGIGTALAVRVLHGRRIKRITGIGLFFELIEKAHKNEWKVYILGASPQSNKAACEILLKRFPGLLIVGHHHGYFKDSGRVIEDINESGAEILFVGMGSPKQEQWIAENRELINACFCMGVGGTLDVVSGNVKWAPAIFRKTGTEWFYRLISEPERWRRQLALPEFVWLLLRYRFSNTKKH